MPTIRELKSTHKGNIEKIKSLNLKIEKEDRDFTKSENSEVEKLFTETENLKNQIEKREKVKDLELSQATLDLPKSEQREFKFKNVIKLLTGKGEGCFEKEVSQELEKRGSKPSTSQGIMVPSKEFFKKETRIVDNATALVSNPVNQAELVSGLYEMLIASQLGLKMITAQGKFTFPKSSRVNAGWFSGDGGSDPSDSISESDPTYSSVSVEPKFLGVISGYSLRQAMDMGANISLESLLREDLSMAMASKLEDAIINGTGSDNQPEGIIPSVTGETDKDLSGQNAVWKIGDFLEEIRLLKVAYKNSASLPRWLISPLVEKELKETQRFSNTNGEAIMTDGSIIGTPAVTSNRMNNVAVIGDWSQAMLTTFNAVEITLGMQGSDFSKGVQRIRAIAGFDVSLRRDEAFRKITIAR